MQVIMRINYTEKKQNYSKRKFTSTLPKSISSKMLKTTKKIQAKLTK